MERERLDVLSALGYNPRPLTVWLSITWRYPDQQLAADPGTAFKVPTMFAEAGNYHVSERVSCKGVQSVPSR